MSKKRVPNGQRPYYGALELSIFINGLNYEFLSFLSFQNGNQYSDTEGHKSSKLTSFNYSFFH